MKCSICGSNGVLLDLITPNPSPCLPFDCGEAINSVAPGEEETEGREEMYTFDE